MFSSTITSKLAHERSLDLREDAGRGRGLTIRGATPADAERLERLAQLDELRAALPVSGGPAIADPFHPSAEVTSLLALRAAQVAGR
jgi:hypothetical protein